MFSSSSNRLNVNDHLNVVSDSIHIFHGQQNRAGALRGELNTLRSTVQNQLLTPHLTEESRKLGRDFLIALNSSSTALDTVDEMLTDYLNTAIKRQDSLKKINKKLAKPRWFSKTSSSLLIQADKMRVDMMNDRDMMLDRANFQLRRGAMAGLELVSDRLNTIKRDLDGLGNINLLN